MQLVTDFCFRDFPRNISYRHQSEQRYCAFAKKTNCLCLAASYHHPSSHILPPITAGTADHGTLQDSLFAPAGRLGLDRVRQHTIIHKGGAIWSSELGEGCKVVVRDGRLFRSDHSGCSPKGPFRLASCQARTGVLKHDIAGGQEKEKRGKGTFCGGPRKPQRLWLADSHEATRVKR